MVLRTVGIAGVVALLYSGVALAAGHQTVTETTHEHDVVLFSAPTTNPCNGEAGTLTAFAENSVFHVTFFEGGDEFWVTGTAEGTATITPNSPGGVSATGHFTSWFGQSGNNKNNVEHDTNTFVLTASDGSHVTVHMTDHVSTNAAGAVTVEFEKEHIAARCA